MALLLLARGEVITVLPRGTILRFVAPALIGGIVALTPVFDQRRIVSVSKCTVLRLPIADWFDAMEDHNELLRRALATLTIEREEALARRAEST